jgi:hypothetical protein
MVGHYLGWIPKFMSDEKTILGIKYAYVVLALMSIVLTAMAIFFNAQTQKANNQKFCEVIVPAVTDLRSQIPKDPALLFNPRVLQNLDWLHRYEHLGKELGC